LKLWDDGDRTVPLGGVLRRVDDAVADLFELSDAERELINDFWANATPAATEPLGPAARSQGLQQDLQGEAAVGDLASYLSTFLAGWNPRLQGDGEFAWQVQRDSASRAVAVIFETRESGQTTPSQARTTEGAWTEALSRIGEVLTEGRAANFRSHGIVRVVTDTAIVIVKRDERRLWTATAAREDVDATLVQAMALEAA
jgi:hypothetical protein